MTQPSYLFYDIETTGLNKCFDQVLQFAAIRTDTELNELERHEFRIKLNPDVIPSPYAIITHHIGINAMQTGDNEYESILKIHRLLNQPGTRSVGYNTLGFDDEFLRFSFYKNLLAPYTHQFANQCGRFDIYPLTILYYLFKRDTLNWPQINGKISMKLEAISAANNLMQGQAHDAMVDVEATLGLARLLAKDQKMWNYVLGFFDKKTDIARGDSLPIAFETADRLYRHGLIINGKLGAKNNFIVPVLSLGQHKHYKNQTLWLRLDQPELMHICDDNIDEKTYVIKKRMAEAEILLPPETRYVEHIDANRQKIAKTTLTHLIGNPKLLHAIADYHQHYKYPDVAGVDIDAALYSQPFATRAEESAYNAFHRAAPAKKLELIQKFPNTRRCEQAHRIIARNYPEFATSEILEEFKDYQEAKVIDYRGEQKFNVDAASLAIAELEAKQLTPEQKQLLDEFHAFLTAEV